MKKSAFSTALCHVRRFRFTVSMASGLFLFLFLAGCSHSGSHTAAPNTIDAQVHATQTAHGLEAWWGKDIVQADVEIIFGGNVAVDGTFIFEAHGPKARYDRKDGVSITFDGNTAWITPPDANANRGRFHVLTWPWFIMAPFKMEGEGIQLSEYETLKSEGKTYFGLKQTFDSGMGDAPEDWYRFLLNPKTHRIESMAYIVTYWASAEEANKKPSIIDYYDYKNIDGTLISTRYEFWLWNDTTYERVGDSPKAVGTVSNVSYPARNDDLFRVPAGALELSLPK